MVKKTLPSGAKLEITLAPFAESKALAQAVLEEMKALRLDPKAEIDVNFRKDLFCTFLASKKVETELYQCLRRVTYNGVRLEKPDDVFEPEAARDDYVTVCWEVALANVLPFTKSLFAEFSPLLEKVQTSLK